MWCEAVYERFIRAPHAGAPDDSQAYHFGEAGALRDGVWVQVWLHTRGGRVADLRYLAHGPPSLVAMAEWLAEGLPGLTFEEAASLSCRQAVDGLNLPQTCMGEALILDDALSDACRADSTPGG